MVDGILARGRAMASRAGEPEGEDGIGLPDAAEMAARRLLSWYADHGMPGDTGVSGDGDRPCNNLIGVGVTAS